MRNRQRSKGFVLVATIWVTAAMVLFMGFIASYSDQVQNDVFLETVALEYAFDKKATEATLIYVSATRGVTYAGQSTRVKSAVSLVDEFNLLSGDLFAVAGDEIRLDGREYLGIGSAHFRIQDAGPLVSLRVHGAMQPDRLEKLLRHYGLSRDQVRQLIGTLQDYNDHDDFLSVDGAESADYERRNALPPTNRFLLNPGELRNVLGWEDALGDQLGSLLNEVTVASGNKTNFNTLTRTGLKTIGMDEAAIEKVIQYRKDAYFRTMFDVNEVAGVLLHSDQLAVTSIPDSFIRLSIWNPASRQKELIGIRLQPTSGIAPWEIDYRLIRQRDSAATNSRLNLQNASFKPTHPPTVLFE